MPAPARQPRPDIIRLRGVIEPPAATRPTRAGPAAPPRAPPRSPPRPRRTPARRPARRPAPDQPSPVGVDPPGQVIGPGELVRVLDRELGLAHPAHPLQRLHHRLIPGQQLPADRHQQPIPPGEPRITRRDVPHRRHPARQPRNRRPPLARGLRCSRQRRRATGAPGTGHRLQQHLPGLLLTQPEDVPGQQRPQHSRSLRGRHILHSHRHQPGLLGTQHVQHRGRPFLRGVPVPVEIRGREQRHHPVAPLQRITHRQHEVPPGRPVPHIQLNRVPGIGQLPGHPLRPRPVRTGMTDEEISAIPHHATSIPATAP